MLTKKHYQACAEILAKHREHCPSDLVADFAAYFKRDNPRFDVARFNVACGLLAERMLPLFEETTGAGHKE